MLEIMVISSVIAVCLIMSGLNKTFICFLLFVILFILTTDIEYKVTGHYTKTDKLVSVAPSDTQLNGSFVLGSGHVNESRYYLLRKEISPNRYRDFEVKHEVDIVEDHTLVNSGKFKQYFICTKTVYDNILFKFNLPEKCGYQRQEIIVPKGYVVKNLSI